MAGPWVSAIGKAAWWIGMALAMGWLAAARMKARPASEARLLRHPWSTLAWGVVITGIFLFCAGGSAFVGIKAALDAQYGPTIGMFFCSLFFLAFAAVGATFIVDYFNAHHDVSELGLKYGSLRGTRDSLAWSEVASVDCSYGMNWFRLETRSGKVARISWLLMGLPEFARLLLAHVPTHAIESKTLQLLQETAAGNPPPLWR